MGILRDKKAYLVFLLPGLLFYIFSVFYPIADSIMLSMKKWNGIGPMKWTGLANYVKMIHDRVFIRLLSIIWDMWLSSLPCNS